MLRLRLHLFGCALVAALASSARADDTFFAERLQPFLQKYCTDCHSGADAEAKLQLDTYTNSKSLRDDGPRWARVVEYLEAGIMPPADSSQPSADEVFPITAWINRELSKFGPAGERNPGRVTIRRLNRPEYNNTIRDLIGLDLKLADEFPSDDVGYGFDNIGDVLSLPTMLMERYLAAAERVAAAALVSNWPPPVEKHHYTGKRLSSGPSRVIDGQARREAYIEMKFPVTGEYIIRCRAHPDSTTEEPTRLALAVDGVGAETFDVEGTKTEPGAYETRVSVKRGVRRISLTFVNDLVSADNPDPEARNGKQNVNSLEIEGPFVGADDLPAEHRRIIFRDPAGPDDVEPCAREIIDRFAARAYRRPATADEVDALWKFVKLALDEGDSFTAGIQLAVTAALVSPHFLYRVELDAADDPSAPIRPLDDYQLASRLSYFLWSSMPDAELFRVAAEGRLSQPDELAAQTRRMLADRKSQALVENFAGQWLQLRNLDIVTPDRKQFTTFDEKLRVAMRRETEMFFESVLREDRSMLDFIDANYTFVNARLARHYEMLGVRGDEFRRVEIADDRRGGLLSQASILTVTSNPTRTSPVKRGRWVLEQLLGTPPPPPPPGIADLEQVVLKGTLREKMEQHRENPSCAVCHSRMDPLGFALENFDAVGGWRDYEGLREIDASGSLPGGQTFGGPAELRTLLKNKPDLFARCLTRKLLTYALGRGLEYYDAEAVHDIARRVAEDDYKLSSLVVEVVRSEPFRFRRSQGDVP